MGVSMAMTGVMAAATVETGVMAAATVDIRLH
jgi:hypothetical protein